MDILKIMKKEFLQNIRDYKVMLILMIMPLVIILILGVAISGAFNLDTVVLESLKVDYLIEGKESSYSDDFEVMITGFIEEENQIKVIDINEGIRRVKDRDADAFVLLNTDTNKITLYANDKFNVNGSIIQITLENFVRQNHLSSVIKVEEISNDKLYTSKISLSISEDASAMDYYGIAMSILFAFYGIPMAISSVIKEKRRETLDRILLSSVNRFEVVLGKTLGSILVSILQVTFVMVGTIVFFNVKWGNVLYAWTMLVTMIFFATSMGVFFGFVFSNEGKAMGVINLLLVAFALFGGSYMPLRDLGLFGEIGKFISPIWWNMNGLLSMIYNNSYNMLLQAMTINIIGGLLLTALTVRYVNRKVVLNG